jgi:uncharacterized protein (TIGR02147 family)
MTNKSIFHYNDYKTYLKALEDQKSYKGFRTRLAEATECQNAFISQVLNGEVNFSLEQALKIADFFKLSEDEHQYFLWMVEAKRAGTTELKKYFQKLMANLRDKNLQLKERFKVAEVLSEQAHSTYYSTWIFTAVHIIVAIPKFNTVKKIASALELPEEKVEATVDFLVSNRLLKRSGQTVLPEETEIYLSPDSPNIDKYLTNWRIEGIKSIERSGKKELRHTAIVSMSHEDGLKFREFFIQTLETFDKEVAKIDQPETLYALNLDFFKLIAKD